MLLEEAIRVEYTTSDGCEFHILLTFYAKNFSCFYEVSIREVYIEDDVYCMKMKIISEEQYEQNRIESCTIRIDPFS